MWDNFYICNACDCYIFCIGYFDWIRYARRCRGGWKNWIWTVNSESTDRGTEILQRKMSGDRVCLRYHTHQKRSLVRLFQTRNPEIGNAISLCARTGCCVCCVWCSCVYTRGEEVPQLHAVRTYRRHSKARSFRKRTLSIIQQLTMHENTNTTLVSPCPLATSPVQ